MKHINLDWSSIFSLSAHTITERLNELLHDYEPVFQKGLGTLTHIQAHLTLTEGTTPRFRHPHSVPFAIKEATEKELEANGTLEKVDHSNWAAPIVPVPKKDGSIRI